MTTTNVEHRSGGTYSAIQDVALKDVQFRRNLKFWHLLIFGMAYMVPLATFGTYGLVAVPTGGHLTTSYIVTLIAMLFTAASYGAMSARYPTAGSAYAYVTTGFGVNAGFIVAWALLLDYLMIPLISYKLIGIYLSEYFPGIPGATWFLISLAIALVMNLFGMISMSRVNNFLMTFQAVFLVTFLAFLFKYVDSDQEIDYLAPLYSSGLDFHSIFAGSAILCLSFLGFDAVSNLSEEAKEPTKSVPRAIVLAVLLNGLIYTAVAYVCQIAYPDVSLFKNPDAASLQLMGVFGGDFLSIFFLSAYLAGIFAAAVVSVASTARLLYALGRDGILPKQIFGRLSPRTATPIIPTLVVGAVSLIGLFIDLDTAAMMVSFGALTAFSCVNLSVIKCCVIDNKRRDFSSLIKLGLMPFIGFLMTAWLWTSLTGLTVEIGLLWVTAGLIYLAWLTRGFRTSAPQLSLKDV